MPVGRLFTDLTVFDVLGNFVPGVVVLAAVVSVLPADDATTLATAPLGGLFVLSFVAFALGGIVQQYASEAMGHRETFKYSVLLVQSNEHNRPPTVREYHPGRRWLYSPYRWWYDGVDDCLRPRFGSSTVTRLAALPARLYRALVEALLLVRIEKDDPLPDLRLAAKTWKIARKRFDLDRTYTNYGDLLHLLSSDLEREGPSRALRFQALRNFQRGMWIACFFVATMYLGLVVGSWFPTHVVSILGAVGIEPWEPAIRTTWSPLWTLSATLFLASYGFWELTEKFEEEFVEYLLTDFVTCHADDHF